MSSARLPRDLHPVAWWVWALGLATAASFTTNPLVLLTIVAVATLVVLARRSEQPWADAFRLYVVVAVVIVVMRVLFRVLLGGGADGGRGRCSTCRRSRCRTGCSACTCSGR